ncbi:MAG: PBP1A family penicillin-binding protein [Pontixanthobacter sp.]
MARRGSRRAASKNRQQSGRGGNRRGRDKSKPSGFRLWFRRLFLWGTALALLGGLFLGLAVLFASRSLPSYSELKATQNAQTIIVRARDGSVIVELGPSYGEWLDSDEIPQIMKEAMISVEDRRYYSHFGIDPIGLGRAVYVAATGNKRVGATSTITQQLARNIFLNSNRTLDRKMREGVLAMALEWKFSKDQILELYLNKVYFGGGAYGIDSASRRFFSHPATGLSTGEAAIIAGLVKAPSRYSPTADVVAAVDRAQVVLRLMKEQGRISDSVTVDLSAVKLKEQEGQNSARYFTDWALPQLDLLLPETFEPIEVWTTLDVGMQRAAAASIKANTPGGAQGALVSLDRDGAILAMIGGTDYVETNYNRATESLRQPGSAWKLFVYLAALEAGYTPESAVKDTAVTIDGWSPRNSGGSYAGDINVRTAFAYSKNTVAAQLGNEVGFGTVASMAKRFGITSPIATYPSMVLGSSEARVIEMTQAFAGISSGGQSVEPYAITRVTTGDGAIIYEHDRARSTRLIPDYVAAGITDLLQTAVNTGTGRAAQIGRPVAGKTGTTSSNKDGWFIGFSSGVTTGVWMGRDDAKPVSGLQGGRAPAQAFAAFMRYAVKDRPVEEFDTELQLPEWQLEPDDEFYFGDPDDYYYIDEQGNLIEPGRYGREDYGREDDVREEYPRSQEPVRGRGSEGEVGDRPQVPRNEAPAAASDDFLDRATGQGRSTGQRPAARPPMQPRREEPSRPPPRRPAAVEPTGPSQPR